MTCVDVYTGPRHLHFALHIVDGLAGVVTFMLMADAANS